MYGMSARTELKTFHYQNSICFGINFIDKVSGCFIMVIRTLREFCQIFMISLASGSGERKQFSRNCWKNLMESFFAQNRYILLVLYSFRHHCFDIHCLIWQMMSIKSKYADKKSFDRYNRCVLQFIIHYIKHSFC